MKVVKTTLWRLAFYYLLLAVSIIPCANIIPDAFPTRNLSTIYLLFFSACLIRYYSYRVAGKGPLPFLIKALSWMEFLLLLLRGLKYSVFAGVDVLARHTWYLYYLPMLLMPTFLLYIALLVSPDGDLHIKKRWYVFGAVSAALIAFVLTNDLHGLVFRFNPGFANWNSDYSRTALFFVTTAWQYVLYLLAMLILVVKCRITNAKKYSWLTLIPFAIGIAMNVLLMTETMPNIKGSFIIEFPEAMIFMVAGVLECCMQLGLIPTNSNYGKLFGIFSLSAQITDKNGTPVYMSKTSAPLTEEQFNGPDGARIDEHTVLHKMELPGGFGFWQDDMTELDRLNGELELAKEELSQETELLRLQNELRENEAKIEQRSAVYDAIAKDTRRQSGEISNLAKTARKTDDPAMREQCRKRITLFASYIKRYANLMLLSYENRTIETGELALSFSEVLRYLNFAGIPGELVCDASGSVSAEKALAMFKVFGALITDNIQSLKGVIISLPESDKTVCKLTLENVEAGVAEESRELLSNAGIKWDSVYEDDVTYLSFTLSERGQSL